MKTMAKSFQEYCRVQTLFLAIKFRKEANILIIFNVIRHLNMTNPLTINTFITIHM